MKYNINDIEFIDSAEFTDTGTIRSILCIKNGEFISIQNGFYDRYINDATIEMYNKIRGGNWNYTEIIDIKKSILQKYKSLKREEIINEILTKHIR